MPLTAADVKELVQLLDDDQLSSLRYKAFEIQENVSETEEQHNEAFREELELELLSAIDAI